MDQYYSGEGACSMEVLNGARSPTGEVGREPKLG
jgi:hypothetical protein